MKTNSYGRGLRGLGLIAAMAVLVVAGLADEPVKPVLPRAFLDGTGPGWRALGEEDFVNVNCNPETWSWKEGAVHCTGQPVGVTRTRKPLGNFELVAQWRHLKSGGNSGIFVWAAERSLEGLKPGACRAAESRFKCLITVTRNNTRSKPARRLIGSRPTVTCFRSAHRR